MPVELADMAALGLFCAGILWALKSENDVRTVTATSTEVVLNNFDFDGMTCILVVHVTYVEDHWLTQHGHFNGSPKLCGLRVIHARCLDRHDRWHDAGPLELAQIDREVRADKFALRELQRLLEAEFEGS
jgi:hypothetical protein